MTVDDRADGTVTPAVTDPAPGADGPSRAELDQERRDLAGVRGSRAARWVRPGLLVAALVALGLWRGLPIVIVILSILVMIFLHELGHFLAARWSGMKATEFFIGFGPRIWSFRRGETEYGIKAIPAGAYVRIIGMNNLEEVDPADEPRTYRQQPFRARLGVAVAGSAMHFAIALVLLVVQLTLIGRPDPVRWEVGGVTPGSAAAAAGVREGDRVVAFDGEPVDGFTEFRTRVVDTPAGPRELVIERDGERRSVTVDLSRRALVVGTIGEDLDLLDAGDGVRVGAVEEGDRVVSINGSPVDSLDDVAGALGASTGGVVVVGTEGSGGPVRHRVDLGSAVDATEPAAFLGVGQRSVLVTESLPSAVGGSVAEFGRFVGVSVAGVGRFLWPPNLVEFLGSATTTEPRDATDTPTPAAATPAGPDAERPISIVGAVMYGSDLTAENASNLVAFLIALNIFIGVFNLIPLLPFDGGHVAIAFYEKAQELRRRQTQRYVADVSRMLPVAYGVVMVLVVVGLLAMYLDLTRGVTT
jgi:RIP metalloprotease RseP